MPDNQVPQNQESQPQAPDFSTLVENGKILGKYDTPEAAKEGYWNAVQEMNKAKEQLGMAVQVIQNLQQQGPPQQLQPQIPAYEAKLDSLGIPLGELNQLVEDRAAKIAKKMFEENITPLVRGAQARGDIAAAYEDFQENEAAILAAVKADPNKARRFDALLQKGEPEAALELAYFHWLRTKQPKPSPEVEAARRAAQTPGGGAGVNRTAGMQTGPSSKDMDDAWQAYYEGGDIRALIDAKLKNVPLTYSEQMEALIRGRLGG